MRVSFVRPIGCAALTLIAASIAVGLAGCQAQKADAPDRDDERETLQRREPTERIATGRSIAATMPAVRQAVGSLPMNLIMTRDRRFAVVSDMGFRESLWTIDARTGKGVSQIEFPHPSKKTNGLYYGLALADEGTLYAAQGANATIAILHLDNNGALTSTGAIKTKKGDFPAGLALDGRGFLFATSNEPAVQDLPQEARGAVVAYEVGTSREVGRLNFDSGVGGTDFPLAIAATRAGRLYIASQRDACLHVIDATDPRALKDAGTISVGSHPSALLMTADEATLFVANANSDTISVVDVGRDTVRQTILMRPGIAGELAGASPVGLTLSPDGKTLYAALGDMNAVAVVGAAKGELLGYVPAGWYPSGVGTDGTHLLVANAKGSQALNPNPPAGAKNQQSPLNILEGDVVQIDAPTLGEALEESTKATLERCRLTPRYLRRDNPLKDVGIDHVIYIVKENRSYDQVLGDLPQGNGDPSRTIFGRDVTPNQHALAERFVLLDNFYDSGEVSGDGWVWSTQAMANEYVIKNIPYHYSHRGRSFDFEGENNGYPTGGFPANDPDGKPLSDDPRLKDGLREIPDVSESAGGHLWDLCLKHGVSFRNYGFFTSGGLLKEGVRVFPDNYPTVKALQPAGHDLAGVSDVDYRRFDLDYADSDGPLLLSKQTGNAELLRNTRTYGKHAAASRFSEWNTEFEQMLARAPDGAAVPRMMFVRLPCDHTFGMNGGKPTPRAMVCDNDYAVGQFVEAVSKSPIWKRTAIFIIEDDSQNGPDHIDAHRSTCYVVSPWTQRARIDHTFHNTVSCVRTMELLLGLPPMNQYDAAADPMLLWSTSPQNVEPFKAILPDAKILAERNPEANPQAPIISPELPAPEQARDELIRESEKMNFAQADQAPAAELNQIIWKSVRGVGSSLPPTPRGPEGLTSTAAKTDDDD